MTPAVREKVTAFKVMLTKFIDSGEAPLPNNVTPDSFRNAAIVAVQNNPKILDCDQATVFVAIRELAAMGLVPNGREAALVPFKTRVNGNYIDACQAMPMVFGLIKSARRSGDVKDIRAHIVYQNELDQGRFSYVIGDEEKLDHEPIVFGDKGPMVIAYAIARLKDGSLVREVMDADEIDQVRRASAAQKIYEKGKKPRVSDEPIGIWADWPGEMWKKSVIRRLCKRLDLSAEDMRLINIEPESGQMRDITPDAPADDPVVEKAGSNRAKLSEIAATARADADAEDAQTIDDDQGNDDQSGDPDADSDDKGDAPPKDAGKGGKGGKAKRDGKAKDKAQKDQGKTPDDGGDPPKPDDDAIKAAGDAGADARASGRPRAAVPEKFAANETLTAAWQEAWDAEDAAS